jgi:polar amino acid transport system substrate-binding protein/glutamate/aspartate transport system substrate-binding protein
MAIAADVLSNIQKTGNIKIGYRADAAPFSYRNEIGEPAGYSVDLCRAVSAIVGKRLNRSISLTYVPVTAKNRFQAVRSGKVDLLCGATTETISRRKLVQFSVSTFVTGASVIYRANGPKDFKALAGRVIGVTRGTTTEKDLAGTLQKLSINAQVLGVRNHGEGLTALQSGQVDAYFGDRAILMSLLRKSTNSLQSLTLSPRHFSIETYALAMPRGNDAFRDQVDWALSYIYKSGGFACLPRPGRLGAELHLQVRRFRQNFPEFIRKCRTERIPESIGRNQRPVRIIVNRLPQ